MKKRLSEIFDEATAFELETFSNSLSVDESENDVLCSIKNKVYEKTGIKARKNINRVWLRVTAVAACVLLVGAAIAIPLLQKGSVDYSPIIFNATQSPEQLTGSNIEFIVGTSSEAPSGLQYSAPSFRFNASGFVVKAKVVKNYPDKYYKLDVDIINAPKAYRLVQMEVIEVINGEDIPNQFLYLIEDYTWVDMSAYDCLLISMVQLNVVQNYVLKNATQNIMEAYECPIFTDSRDEPELGNIIAFTDGKFDESLWQNDNWYYGYQFGKYYLNELEKNPDFWHGLVVSRGDSVEDAIGKINEQIEGYGDDYTPLKVVTFDFKSEEAIKALDYVAPFKNGVFAQEYYRYRSHPKVQFRRFINGCQTEETVTIDLETEEVTYSEVRYTKEDMEAMENLAVHISEMAKEYAEQTPTPPHTDASGKKLWCLNIFGWYAKVDGKPYGVITTTWFYLKEDNYHLAYYDEKHILYDMEKRKATVVSGEDLLELVGFSRNFRTEGLGVPIELPYQ